MASIGDLPLDVATKIVEMSERPAEVASTCRFLRDAAKNATTFKHLEFRAPWLGNGTDALSKTRTATIDVPTEDDSNALVEWMRTRPRRGFDNVESVRATMHSTSFRAISTLLAFSRAFPRLRRLTLESSGGFDLPRELVFPARGFECLETFDAVLPHDSECWLEIFAGYPRPPKLRAVCVTRRAAS
jgi:hypothetical protein